MTGKKSLKRKRPEPCTEFVLSKKCSENLSVDIVTYYNRNFIRDYDYKQRILFCACLNKIIQSVFPNTQLFLVGSSMNGTGTKKSDLDLSLSHTAKLSQLELRKFLLKLRSALEIIPEIRKSFVIRARIPIIRFHLDTIGVMCDISISSNNESVHNSYLIGMYAKLDEKFRILCIWIKYWADQLKVADASRGNMSSYCMTLLILQYFHNELKILPNLVTKYPHIFNINNPGPLDYALELEEAMMIQNRYAIEDLFIGFLGYYSDFDFTTKACSFMHGGIVDKRMVFEMLPEKKTSISDHLFFIQDPLTMNNAAAGFKSRKNVEKLINSFKMSFTHFFNSP